MSTPSGCNRHVEAVGEVDHRADDRGRLRIAAEIHHKGAVDLDLVERKGLRIAQRRIAAAEIVHRDAHAERLQPAQRRMSRSPKSSISTPSLISSSSQPAPSASFQQDRVRTKTDHVFMHRAAASDRLTNLQRLGPGRRFATGFAQDPFAHLDDQAAFLGKRNELARRHEAAYRMVPARKRLEARDFALGGFAGRYRLRLIVQRQLVSLDRNRRRS